MKRASQNSTFQGCAFQNNKWKNSGKGNAIHLHRGSEYIAGTVHWMRATEPYIRSSGPKSHGATSFNMYWGSMATKLTNFIFMSSCTRDGVCASSHSRSSNQRLSCGSKIGFIVMPREVMTISRFSNSHVTLLVRLDGSSSILKIVLYCSLKYA